MMDNLNAFLTMIRVSELTQAIIDGSDNGYNVIVGSTPSNIVTFDSYDDHPRKSGWLPKLGIYSTAAGGYQIREHIFDQYKTILNLPDFSPASQDKIAVRLITECRALQNITNGLINEAILQCSSRWASLPGNYYGQYQNAFGNLRKIFAQSGGTLANGEYADVSSS